MPKIVLSADYREAQRANADLVASLQSVDQRIGSVTSRMATFNARGVETGAVIKGLTKDGQEFTAVLGGTTKQLAKAASEGKSFALAVKQVKFKEYAADADAATQATKKLEAAFQAAVKAAAATTAARKKAEEAAAKTAAPGPSDPSRAAKALDSALRLVTRSAEYFVTYRAFNRITEEIEAGVTAASRFQIQLSLIRTLSQQNQQTSGAFGAQVRRSSDKSGFSLEETGKAFYDAISNQVAKGDQVEAFTDKVAQLARVTGSNLTDAGNAVTASINAYGLSANDADRVSAVLFRTIDEGRVVMSELANTLGRVQVLAANVGVSMEEVSSVLAITTQKGFKTADAMTLLTNLLIKLEKPTESTKKFFEGLGVSSGEEAIRLYGFYGIMQKIVEEVRSGRTDVSAFFDEIRGRKQFAVFEQSIDQMARFSDELSDTGANIAAYNQAVAIRGESPADYLNNEINQIKNVFAVNVGTKILETTADIVKFTKSTAAIAEPITDKVIPTVGKLTVGLLAYAAATVIVNTANTVMATGFTTWINGTRAALTAFANSMGGFLVSAWAAYEVGKAIGTLVNKASGASKLDVDGAAIERGIERRNLLLRQAAEGTRVVNLDGSDNRTSLEETGDRATEAYRRLQGILAQVNLTNNRLLEDAKRKSQEVGEATKVAFTSFADRLKESIAEFKKNATEARNEIEKSKKSLADFRLGNRDAVFNVQSQYATDDQRVILQRNRIEELLAQARTLLAPGATADQRDQGRRIYDQIRDLEAENFKLKTDIQIGRNRAQGGSGLTVSTLPLERALAGYAQERAAAEERIQQLQTDRLNVNNQLAQSESRRLDTLQQALKNLQELSPFDNSGKPKEEFQTGGKFDQGKFEAEVRRREAAVREVGAGTADQRFDLEIAFTRFRMARIQEAAAFQRSEDIKTIQAQITAQQEATQKKIEDEKKAREKFDAEQATSRNALRDRTQDFNAFRESAAQVAKRQAGGIYNGRNPITGTEYFSEALPPSYRAAFANLDQKIQEYQELVRRLEANAEVIGGKRVYREGDVNAVRTAAVAVQEAQRGISNRAGVEPTVNGQTLSQSVEDVRNEITKLQELRAEFLGSLTRQNVLETELRNLQTPIQALRTAFPELATASDLAFAQIQRNATTTVNDALKPLLDRVQELRRELNLLNQQQANPGPRAALDQEFGGEVFAAYGGQAGRFPGQPRGKDRYPIWAAKGEYIVNAESSKQFRPMLEAINNRRSPRYMAQGGVVGGDTNIGDINVTVNGGATNSDTGRAIAAKLEREFRRGTITKRGR